MFYFILFLAVLGLALAVYLGLNEHKRRICPRCHQLMDWEEGYSKWHCRHCGANVRK